MRKTCRWKTKVLGYIPLPRTEKKRETAEMKPHTAPASVHIPQLIPTTSIKQWQLQRRPRLSSSFSNIFPRGCTHVQRDGRKTYFSMRLLTAFSTLPSLLQMYLKKK